MSQPEQRLGTPRTALSWPAERHAAYLDRRPDQTSLYNPAAEYGGPVWREPASDAEAAARTAWLADNTPPAPGWPTRPLTPVEGALEDAQERVVLADRAHDSDPYAWADYQRLQALDRLAPLPSHDALDDLPRDEHGQPDTFAAPSRHDEEHVARDHLADEAAFDGQAASNTAADQDGSFTDAQGRWWPSTGARVAGACDPSRGKDFEHLEAPDDPEDLRQRIESLRGSLAQAAREGAPDEDDRRREQLARWHEDDHATRVDTEDRGNGAVGELGWGR